MTCGFPRAVCMPMLEEEIVDGTKSDEGGMSWDRDDDADSGGAISDRRWQIMEDGC